MLRLREELQTILTDTFSDLLGHVNPSLQKIFTML